VAQDVVTSLKKWGNPDHIRPFPCNKIFPKDPMSPFFKILIIVSCILFSSGIYVCCRDYAERRGQLHEEMTVEVLRFNTYTRADAPFPLDFANGIRYTGKSSYGVYTIFDSEQSLQRGDSVVVRSTYRGYPRFIRYHWINPNGYSLE